MMRITFTQSGGFAGLVRSCAIDASSLPAEERHTLEQLVRSSGLTGSWNRFAAAARDLKQYEIVIDRDGTAVRVACDDHCLPEAARPLVGFLQERARPGLPLPAAAGPAAAAGREATAGRDAGAAWGRFVGDVVARWHDDGRAMTLVEPFAYVDPRSVCWDAAAGSVVNGASIPQAFWSLIGGPFEGRFRNASVVHDVACEDRRRPWQEVHRMFHDACRCGGVTPRLAATMYYAVHHFGPRWRFEERRTIVAGRTTTERVTVAEPVPEPPAGVAARAAEWFATHDVDPDAVPALSVPPDG